MKMTHQKAALVASISLNLAFIGVAAAFVLKEETRGRHYFFDRASRQETVSPEVRAAFGDAMESVKKNTPGAWKTMRREREQAILALTSDPIDVEAFRAHNEAATKERNAMKAAFRGAAEKLAASLSPEKRKELAALLRDMRHTKQCGDKNE
ncbi:MAG: periplasmic heavy metal sensor [Rickettsiales bacterium]